MTTVNIRELIGIVRKIKKDKDYLDQKLTLLLGNKMTMYGDNIPLSDEQRNFISNILPMLIERDVKGIDAIMEHYKLHVTDLLSTAPGIRRDTFAESQQDSNVV